MWRLYVALVAAVWVAACVRIVPEIPPELIVPQVWNNEAGLSKTQLVEISRPPGFPHWTITGLQTGSEALEPVIRVLIGNTQLFTVAPTSGEVLSEATLDDGCLFPEFVDVEVDGVSEILCPGGGFSDPAVLNADGTVRWSRDGSFLVDDVAAAHMSLGNLNGDEIAEFCVAFSHYLACFDSVDREIWRTQMAWYEFVRIASSDGVPVVVARGAPEPACCTDYFVEVRTESGELIRRRPFPYETPMDVVEWPLGSGRLAFLTRDASALRIVDLELQELFRYELPPAWMGPSKYGPLQGMLLDSEGALYLVVHLWYRVEWERSSLLLFSPDGALIYHEVMERAGRLFSVRLPTEPVDDSLVFSNWDGGAFAYRRPSLGEQE